MIQAIVSYLQAVLVASNYFEKVYPLCEILENPNEKKPAHYKCLGQYEDINIDHENGTAYFLRDGDPTYSPYSGNLITDSCSDFLTVKFPLKAILTVPKAKLSTDDEYTDDRIAQTLVALMGAQTYALKVSLNAKDINIFSPKYSTDKLRILKDQYGANATREPNYKLAYLSLSLSVEVVVNSNCLTTECNLNPENFVFTPLGVFCEAVANCSIIETILAALEDFSGLVIGETPTGAVDGANQTFTTANNYQAGKIAVYRNGQRQTLTTDYMETGANTYQFVVAPFLGDVITNDYLKA